MRVTRAAADCADEDRSRTHSSSCLTEASCGIEAAVGQLVTAVDQYQHVDVIILHVGSKLDVVVC
jgi:hypothetical protein